MEKLQWNQKYRRNNMSQPEIPPQMRIWQLGLGFANTSAIYTLVKTGVIEQLRNQPKDLLEIAKACNLNSEVLYRVLRYATVIDIVTKNEEKYSLTETGKLLLKDVPGSLYTGILLVGSEPWQRSWQNLDHSITTGGVAFDQVMDEGFFNYLDQHPEYGDPYNKWMSLISSMTASAISEAYDFSAFNSVCDVGGGQGILLKQILTSNPHLKGILYDQESVLKGNLVSDMADRVTISQGNFFENVPQADVLMMKNILHDWNDEKCQIILNHCKAVMNPSSRLLVIEMLIGTPADLMGTFYDLHMQVLLGGKERTEEEFGELFAKIGLKLVRVIPTKSPMKIIEASL
jgi:predicted transcriptional regulator